MNINDELKTKNRAERERQEIKERCKEVAAWVAAFLFIVVFVKMAVGAL
jgi:hypothetical protein